MGLSGKYLSYCTQNRIVWFNNITDAVQLTGLPVKQSKEFLCYMNLCTSSKRPFFVSFSRHLPMIAAQLRGRVHLKSKEFANQQHIFVFSHILGVLDLLRPHIFRQDKVCGLLVICHTTVPVFTLPFRPLPHYGRGI